MLSRATVPCQSEGLTFGTCVGGCSFRKQLWNRPFGRFPCRRKRLLHTTGLSAASGQEFGAVGFGRNLISQQLVQFVDIAGAFGGTVHQDASHRADEGGERFSNGFELGGFE